MTLTAGEQYLLELINRARLDPAAEAGRYHLALNAGLPQGTIGTEALQVLAPNAQLEAAAVSHSAWMLSTNDFSHTGLGGSDAGARIQQSGYQFSGQWSWRENLAWLGSTSAVDMQAAVALHHEGLYRSATHRENTFTPDLHEIGIGQVAGRFTIGKTTYNSSMLTEKFAISGGDVFLTGVAYRDADRDGFYSIGEGQGNMWFHHDNQTARTTAAGSYVLEIAPQQDLRVAVGQGSRLMAVVETDLSAGNVKLDLVTQADNTRAFNVSGDTTLVWGVGNANLLGSGNLELTGHAGANQLTGNNGNNRIDGAGGNDRIWGMNGTDLLTGGLGNDRLYGGNGNDKLFGGDHMDWLEGGDGNDVLWGGQGNDRLIGGNGIDILIGNGGRDFMFGGAGNDRFDGGAGSDVMTGGAGGDTFIFSAHRDVITDFTDNVDTILIRSWLGDPGMTAQDVLNLGEIHNGNAVFDFGNNHVLTVQHVDDLNILANDLMIL